MDELTGKVAVVTGAAGGIGGAVARALADAGAEVVGIDREQADLTAPDDVARAFAGLERVDVLVNAAGISGRSLGDGPVEDCTEEAWDAVLDTNLKSVFLCCKHAIPRLRAAGGGAIVNVSSVLGLVGGDEDFATHAYAASKAGIIGLSRSIAVHYAPEGIRCNVVAPGLVATPMSARAQGDERIRGAPRASCSRSPATSARPRTSPARCSTSRRAGFVTGAVLTVDGGWTAR